MKYSTGTFCYRLFLSALLAMVCIMSPGRTEEKIIGGKTEAGPVVNYYNLKKHYTKWHEGLWGSRTYNKHELEDFLKTLKGKFITTPREFMLLVPESLAEPRVICNFKTCRWLKIYGPLDRKSLDLLVKNNPSLLKNWWRSRKLLSIKGRIRKFRLTRDAGGDIIELWLKEILSIP